MFKTHQENCCLFAVKLARKNSDIEAVFCDAILIRNSKLNEQFDPIVLR